MLPLCGRAHSLDRSPTLSFPAEVTKLPCLLALSCLTWPWFGFALAEIKFHCNQPSQAVIQHMA